MTTATSEVESEVTVTKASGPKVSWVPLACVGGLLLLSLAMFLKIQSFVADPGVRTPHRYILPAGFTGKIRVLYNVPGAKPLALEEGHLVVPVPLSGMFETSTPLDYGTAPDQFFRHLRGGGLEHLRGNYLKERKIGVIGDGNEYFERPSETEIWRQEMVRKGFTDADGEILLGGTSSSDPAQMIHYELMVVRDEK